MADGPTGAVAALSAAVSAEPGRGDLWGELATALVAAGRAPEAWDAAVRAVERAPQSAASHRAIGTVAAALGDSAQAEAAYRHAQLLDRTSSGVGAPAPAAGGRHASDDAPAAVGSRHAASGRHGVPAESPGGRRRAPEEVPQPSAGRRRAPEGEAPTTAWPSTVPPAQGSGSPGRPSGGSAGGGARPGAAPALDSSAGTAVWPDGASQGGSGGGGAWSGAAPAPDGGPSTAVWPAGGGSGPDGSGTAVWPARLGAAAWGGGGPVRPAAAGRREAAAGLPGWLGPSGDPRRGAVPTGATRVSDPEAWRRGLVAAVRIEWLVGVACFLGLAYARTAPYTAGLLAGALVAAGAYGRLRWQSLARRGPPEPDRVPTYAAVAALATVIVIIPAAMVGALTLARLAAAVAVTAVTAAAVLLPRTADDQP